MIVVALLCRGIRATRRQSAVVTILAVAVFGGYPFAAPLGILGVGRTLQNRHAIEIWY